MAIRLTCHLLLGDELFVWLIWQKLQIPSKTSKKKYSWPNQRILEWNYIPPKCGEMKRVHSFRTCLWLSRDKLISIHKKVSRSGRSIQLSEPNELLRKVSNPERMTSHNRKQLNQTKCFQCSHINWKYCVSIT